MSFRIVTSIRKQTRLVAVLAALASAGLCATAARAEAAAGGFTGPGPGLVTVEQARALPDDAPLSIKGRIVQHLGKDKYLFRDETGEITVEIDHDLWRGLTVGPEDTVVIHGEMDKEWLSAAVDADSISKL